LYAIDGLHEDAPRPPCVVGLDAAGVVESAGSAVSHVKPGDRVIVLRPYGVHSDRIVVAGTAVFKMPEQMSFVEAGAFAYDFLSAYLLLFRVARISPGDTVLVRDACDGVSIAVAQLCRCVPNVRVLGTGHKLSALEARNQGFETLMEEGKTDVVAETLRRTGNRGVQLLLDQCRGGESDMVKFGAAIAPLGMHVVFEGGAYLKTHETRYMGLQRKSLHPFEPLTDRTNKAAARFELVDWLRTAPPHEIRNAMGVVLELYRRGYARPQVDSVTTFADAPAAFARLAGGLNFGRVLLAPEPLPASEPVAASAPRPTAPAVTTCGLVPTIAMELERGGEAGAMAAVAAGGAGAVVPPTGASEASARGGGRGAGAPA